MCREFSLKVLEKTKIDLLWVVQSLAAEPKIMLIEAPCVLGMWIERPRRFKKLQKKSHFDSHIEARQLMTFSEVCKGGKVQNEWKLVETLASIYLPNIL